VSFLYPGILWLGAIASAAVVALHFIVTRQPRSEVFPTARFVPDNAVKAVSRSDRPTDLLLMMLRVLAIMSIAAAFARPVISSYREPKARIILADLSRSSHDIRSVTDSVTRYFREGDILVGFDSAARLLEHPDSLENVASSSNKGSLSAALVLAIRSASRLRERADSIGLTVVSAFPAASWDAATDTIRSLWPGSVEIVRVPPRQNSVIPQPLSLVTDFSSDDPLRFAVALAGKNKEGGSVHIIRSGPLPAPKGDQEVLLHWPIAERPVFAGPARKTVHGALIAGSTVLVAPFATVAEFPADSLKGARITARWEDGSPAAIQRAVPGGCVRSANIPVTTKGDLVIRPEFISIVSALLQPCDALASFAPASEAALLRLKGGSTAAPRAAFPPQHAPSSPLAFWLLAASVGCLVAELFLRRVSSKKGELARERVRAAA
jgi:hypothetical protein